MEKNFPVSLISFGLFGLISFAFVIKATQRAKRKLPPTKSELISGIKKIFADHVKSENIPGCIYAVISKDDVIVKESIGFTSLEERQMTNQKSRFRIASMTKSVTAMAIVHLRDRGILSLSDSIEKYIPEASKLPRATADSPVLTIYHLLIMQGETIDKISLTLAAELHCILAKPHLQTCSQKVDFLKTTLGQIGILAAQILNSSI